MVTAAAVSCGYHGRASKSSAVPPHPAAVRLSPRWPADTAVTCRADSRGRAPV